MKKTGSPSEQYFLDNFDRALKDHEIQLYFQPAVRTISGKMCGMEVLARWDTPEYGIVGPGAFIPLLEKHRLIHRLDTYMVENLCGGLRLKLNEGRQIVPVSFNLSRLDFELCDIFQAVEDAVRKNEIPKEMLQVELTESILNENPARMKACMDQFHEMGYQVWMDDFGSGYSSLNMLKDYDFDLIKIDLEFFRNFSARSRKILRSIVSMMKDIGMKVQAEGVETEEQFRFLRNIGCDNVQGFLFGRPTTLSDLGKNMRRRGIPAEKFGEQEYYDEISRVNILSPSPFLLGEEPEGDESSASSIPLGIVEVCNDNLHFLYHNASLDEELRDLRTDPDDEGLNSLRSSASTSKMQLWDRICKTREDRERSFSIVERGSYYMVQTKFIAEYDRRFAVLLSIRNMLKNMDIYRHTQMDMKLRYLYSIYDVILLVNGEKENCQVLYASGYRLRSDVDSIVELRVSSMIERFVYPEDREEMRRRLDAGTVRESSGINSEGFAQWTARTLDSPGNYSWKLILLIRISSSQVMLCIRKADPEKASLLWNHDQEQNRQQKDSSPAGQTAEKPFVSKEKLWDTFSAESGYGVFWKDKDRRFLGVNQKFLDYYGFSSQDILIGKTDEDMGWHVNPNPFRNDELDVLQKGVSIFKASGKCLANGTNHSIQATKMPIYKDGQIIGLFGFFAEAENDAAEEGGEARNEANRYLDSLTGLLNMDGLQRSIRRYEDSYSLYAQDFAWYCVTIDNFRELSEIHGRDFILNMLAAIADVLRNRFGTSCSIARYVGDTFVLLNGFSSPKAAEEMSDLIEKAVGNIRRVNGVSCTLFPSVGSACFSESGNAGAMEILAAQRMAAERARHQQGWNG